MDFTIQHNMPARVAYIRRTGPYGEENFAVMAKLKNWAAEQKLFHENTVIIAAIHDNAAVTPPEECRYDAGVVVQESFNAGEGDMVQYAWLAGGRYAVFKVRHTTPEVMAAWQGMFPALEKAQISIDASRPVLERYFGTMEQNEFCDICVPVLG